MMCDNSFGNTLCNLRRKKGMTQRDLADVLNISDKAVSRWETGNTIPSLDMVYKISQYFKISFNDLMTLKISNEHINNDGVLKEIGKKEKNNKKLEILKIIGILVSFFRLIVHIIEIILIKI